MTKTITMPFGWRHRKSKSSSCPSSLVYVSLWSLLVVSLQWKSVQPRPILATVQPSNRQHNTDLASAMMYLMKYGYMDLNQEHQRSAALLSQDGLQKYLISFQSFVGINQTGKLDEETMKWMKMPRCGVKDTIAKEPPSQLVARRKKRYALQGSRWRVKKITYKVSNYPSTKRLSKFEVDREIHKALSVWSEHTDLEFEQRDSGQVHIDIRFESGEHGDGDPFDGTGGTLAHAFFPVYGGDAHFDDDENWTINNLSGTNLLQTAAHEFGHSLGLSHSDKNAALMAPFYRGYESKPKLHLDDIQGIQALYGKKSPGVLEESTSESVVTKPKSVITSTSTVAKESPLCSDAKLNAVVTVKDGTTYVFKGSQYYRLTEESLAEGYPRPIAKDWKGLPDNVDAAFTWTNGKTYFFKGTQYWRFTNTRMDDNYPKPMTSGFDGIPNFVDAAFVWSGNGKIYFFKGDKYYRFDPDKRPPVSNDYPKPISNWEGIPNDIDDALQYSNKFTYFFKNGHYWRFDDKKFKVDTAEPPFPRPVGPWWFGCKDRSKGRPSADGDSLDAEEKEEEDLKVDSARGLQPSWWQQIFNSLRQLI